MAAPTEIDLSKGGVVTLVLGQGYDVPTEFAYHPQVHSINAQTIDPKSEGWVPSTTRIVIHTDHIPDRVYQYLQTILRQRRLTYLTRKTPGAILTELQRLLPKQKAEAMGNGSGNGSGAAATTTAERLTTRGTLPKMAPRGSIQALVAELADLSKGSGEEGRRLFKIAQAKGIKTTLASVTQGVAKAKRKGGRGDIPVSAQPVAQAAGTKVYTGITTAVEALKMAIKELEGLRDAAETLEKDKAGILAENQEMRARIDLIESAWRGLK